MTELTIYDSQGREIDAEAGPASERIKDFFFDGVRFAVDTVRQEAVCFFRARESSASRSEQYYAVYNYRTRSQLTQLPDRVESRVQDDLGMEIDGSQDDTKIFEQIRSGADLSHTPGDFDLHDDLQTVAENGVPIRLGTSSYEDAYALFLDWYDKDRFRRFAIADNAQSSNLDQYDVTVEPGAYSGLEPLGETAEELEAIRERRRQRLAAREPGPEGPIEFLEEKVGKVGIVGLFGIVLVLGLALVGYGVTCELGIGPNLADRVPVVECGGDGESAAPTVSLQSATFDGDTLSINGTVENATDSETPLSFTIVNESDSVVHNTSLAVEPNDDGTFTKRINQSLENGTYNLTATVDGQDSASNSVRFSVGANTTASSNVTATVTATPTAIPTATPTATPTPTATLTQTLTPAPTPTVTTTPTATPTDTTTSTTTN